MKRPNLNPTSVSVMRTPSTIHVKHYSSVEYKAIFKTVLIGSFILVAILTILLCISFWALKNTYVLGRIALCGGALVYLAITQQAWIKGHHHTASRLLIFFYFFIAMTIMIGWGIDTTFAQLMLATTIVLTGILLGARSILFTTAATVIGMVVIQLAVNAGSAPWFAHSGSQTNFGDVAGFSAILSTLALITGLFDIRTQELHAEELSINEELAKEKGTLEQRVRKRTKQLENLRLEQTEQLYRFAEIGQLSTLLLHNLSNHLTVLNIDLADFKHQKDIGPAQLEESIRYLEDAVQEASQHLQGKEEAKEFDVLACIEASTKLPHYQDLKESISITAPSQKVLFYGDPLRLSHILFILIRNALEAYPDDTPNHDRTVLVQLAANTELITVSVTDNGRGIPDAVRSSLFNPIVSTKKGGLGIGLFIAKEITESYFGGTLHLDEGKQTKFVLTIPMRSSDHDENKSLN